MKPSINVPLTRAQRKALVNVAMYWVNRYPNEIRNPALRNAIKRIRRAERICPIDEGSVVGAAASGADGD